ncbi:MAG: hypothetical protein WCW64_00795 [Phycisphaerae bacterium]|jgi:hypothetical protein
MAGQHGNEFSKYRKSKTRSIDGSVPGISYNRFRSNLTPSLRSGNGKPAGYQHDLYMHNNPKEYRPNINAPSVNWDEYERYEPSDVHRIPIHDNPQPLHGFSHNSIADTFLDMVPENEHNAGADIYAPKPTPEDIARRFLDLTDALNCLQETLPKEHPDVLSLRDAISEIINDPALISKLETLAGNDRPSKLGSGNPYVIDVFEQMAGKYDQQVELFENSASQLSPVSMFEPETVPDAFAFEHLGEHQTLDDIVANEDVRQASVPDFMEAATINAMQQTDEAAIAEEINQAIDQIIEPPLPQEPDPFSMQEDPYLIAQKMFDQQMQLMNNQFMMPGQ